jgi:hypothetical protein
MSLTQLYHHNILGREDEVEEFINRVVLADLKRKKLVSITCSPYPISHSPGGLRYTVWWTIEHDEEAKA